MKIIDGKALLLKLRNPKRITEVIPKSKVVRDNEVLVNWGIDEVHSLRSLNVNAPSPIQHRYDWTGKYDPFAHQKKTASFFTMNQKSFCFNEQGTGKTASAIWAADYLLKQGKINRVLVVCPLSIMDSAWREDLFTFAPHRSVDIIYGTPKKRKKLIEQGADFAIINYDGIDIVFDEIVSGGFDLIIVDEATHYKNAQSKRWKTMNKLIGDDTWVWMMTGTPAAQSPLDAYGLAKLVNPNSVPRFFGSFRDMVMRKVTQFRWMVKPEASDLVYKVLQPAIRFTKEECLDLPDMTYVKRKVEMTRQQQLYYDKLKKNHMMTIGEDEVSAVNSAVIINKLLQISAGAVYTDNGDTLEFDIKHRYKVLKEVIDESSQKVLIFVPFKHTIDILVDKLRKDGLTTEVIRGDVPVAKRTDIFKRFQTADDPKVLVIQPQSAAHGVTLTAANTVVWWGPTPSLETYAQANARVHRSGQKHPCTVVQLQGSPAEKRIYSLLDNRINVHTKMIDLYKELLD
jgi:SNF2 family DNA or RNA helicase|tara:strand:+ start:3429 stop:4964 length:1536 start_codon:yes stop_codon:yes gene_type:complete